MAHAEVEQAVESTLFRETDRRPNRRFEEIQQEIAALSEPICAAEDLFTSQWERLMEALVEPSVASLFQARGIAIDPCNG